MPTGRLTRLAVIVAALVVLAVGLTALPLTVILGPPDWRTVDIPLKYWPREPRPTPVAEEAPPPDQPQSGFDARPAEPAAPPTARDAGQTDAAPPPSRALEDTTVDGELVAGADGHFQPTAAAIRLFRYFMTANGEWRRDRVRAAIQGEIDARLAPPASTEARAFLEQYFRYLDASRSLAPAGLRARDLAGRLEQVGDLQRAIFGDALADELFGPENDQAAAALERIVSRLAPERAPGGGDRGGERLSDETRAARERATAPSDGARKVEELRGAGADPAEVRAERVRRYGEEAAARLEDVDHERAEWDARLGAHRVARDRILADESLDAAQRVDALDRLREERFSADEARRVAELDRLDALFPTIPPR
ncbi:MAG: hypothetical protein IPK07_24550 [Deltaproteobacteria bacterium]|nr:hypothetical protein [Deltaproteobacteria bacterium]